MPLLSEPKKKNFSPPPAAAQQPPACRDASLLLPPALSDATLPPALLDATHHFACGLAPPVKSYFIHILSSHLMMWQN
jgi:hypothetical protein